MFLKIKNKEVLSRSDFSWQIDYKTYLQLTDKSNPYQSAAPAQFIAYLFPPKVRIKL